jgi:glycolate oxidase iron-sulfur subunit
MKRKRASAIVKGMNRIALPTVESNSRPGSGIDYELFLDCVHCGLCTSACPTYLELGTEMDSPRGRIYLMRGIVDGRIALDEEVRRHLDLCLDCRACETACPSGVKYGRLIEPFRVDLQKLDATHKAAVTAPLPCWLKLLLFRIFPYKQRARLALLPARVLQSLGLDRFVEKSGLVKLLPTRWGDMLKMLPPLSRRFGRLPEVLPAMGTRRARVALFTGCIADVIFGDVNWMTARVLQLNGCEVVVPKAQVCCGALHFHAGQDQPALAFARNNIRVFLDHAGPLDAIIVNVAGCGSMLKEYDHLFDPSASTFTAGEEISDWPERARRFSHKVRDVHEFLMELGPVAPRIPVPLTATYHDACHLCHAQKIRTQPRELLGRVPGLRLIPLAESEVCCGAAGSYNLTQPEMAERLGRRKAQKISETGADVVLTANAGCLMQIRRHLKEFGSKAAVLHPVEMLWWSYEGHAVGDPPWQGRL